MSKDSVVTEEEFNISRKALERIVREQSIKTDRNWWFYFCCGLSVIVILLLMNNVSLRNELTYKYEVAYVKMYHNGSWDIEFNDSERGMERLPATVDSILSEWVERRFSKYKHSVEYDYGYANLLMSPSLSSEFTATEGFNAPQKAADIVACHTCPDLKYKAGTIDHFSSNPSKFGTEEGTLYQSQVFVEKFITSGNSMPINKNEIEQRIVRVQWRLMSPREIKLRLNQAGGKEWLKDDPIGLEIIGYEELEETK